MGDIYTYEIEGCVCVCHSLKCWILTIEVSAWCQLMELSIDFGKRSTVFSKDSFASLLISMHLTDLKTRTTNLELIYHWVGHRMRLPEHLNRLRSCLHFLEAANDNPITPAPAYKSATAVPYGTYFCNLRSKESKAWTEAADQQHISNISLKELEIESDILC